MNRYASRINQQASPFKVAFIPIACVILGSLTPLLPIVASAPILPPFGLMFLLAWRMLRPGFWPVWIGVPLGLFDDLFSGQPVGSAVFSWSAILLILEIIDQRYLWRGFIQDWLIASLLLIFSLVTGLVVINAHMGAVRVEILGPQILISIFLYPAVVRLVAWLDRKRYQV